MRQVVVEVLLAGAVLSIWLGSLSFLRLAKPLDRLHCVTFANVGAAFFMTAAAFADEGVTTRCLKLLAISFIVLLTGAATSHATARAIWLRQGDQP